MNYIDQLIAYCHEAKKASPIHTFEMKDLSQLEGITHAIYVIEEIDGVPNETFEALRKYKAKKERACPKLNKLNKQSSVLYVGSTTTGLRKRIIQHIGDGPKQTYALHLKHWFKGKRKITIREYDTSKAVLQIIEDALSEELKPAFGKTGGNNK